MEIRALSVTAMVKTPCKKYKTMVMRYIFQVEWWEKYPSGCHFGLLWLKEIVKGNGKGFGKAKRHYWHLFIKIKIG